MPASVANSSKPGKRPRSPSKQRSPPAPSPKKQRAAPSSPQQPSPAPAGNSHNSSAPPTAHGSYRNYYKRRLHGNDPSTDDRLPLVRQLFPAYKPFTMLDIGCNDGQILMQLAQHPDCANAVGLDIDAKLVRKARGALRLRIHNHNKAKSNSISFPFNTSFRVEDMSIEQPPHSQHLDHQYNLVLCLSVTKWVHLKGGDAAVQRLFHTMYKRLKPGGVLVLEPQPPKSYKLARQKGLAPKNASFDHLKLKPSMFPNYLLNQCGFSAMRVLRDKSPSGKAFNRPIFAFFKGEHSPSLKLFDQTHPQQSHKTHQTTNRNNSNQKGASTSPKHQHSEPSLALKSNKNAITEDNKAKNRHTS